MAIGMAGVKNADILAVQILALADSNLREKISWVQKATGKKADRKGFSSAIKSVADINKIHKIFTKFGGKLEILQFFHYYKGKSLCLD